MRISVLILLITGSVLAGCARDVNLANDVNNLIPTPKPGLDTIMSQQAQPTSAPTVSPTMNPTPVPTPTATPEVAGVLDKQSDVLVTLKTAKGDISLKLFTSQAPNTVKNFLEKAKSGYYAGLTFHRVESWVIQGGDPKGTGTGGGTMSTELNQIPFKTGSVGVARGGDIKISNDSQFFICTDDCSWLTGLYTNFGEVVNGIEVAKQIAIGDKIVSIVE